MLGISAVFNESLRILNNRPKSRYSSPQGFRGYECVELYFRSLIYASRHAQGNLYHLLLPNYLFELTGLHNTLSPDIRRPSLSSTHAGL